MPLPHNTQSIPNKKKANKMLSMVVCSFSKSSDHFVDVNKMLNVIKIYFSSFIIFAGTGVCQMNVK